MTALPRIARVELVMHGVIKLVFDDGHEGVADLRPLIAKGKIFAWLEAPENFAAIRIDDFGHSISWIDDSGHVIDLGADSLRRDAERQAETRRQMVD